MPINSVFYKYCSVAVKTTGYLLLFQLVYSIRHNPKITVDNKSIFFKINVNTGFIFVGDLLNIDGTFFKF